MFRKSIAIAVLAASAAFLPGVAPDIANAASGMTVGLTMGSARMRAGPDRDYPTVRTFDGNIQVQIYGCLNDWSWCDVGYGNDRGWIAGDELGADYQGRRQTIVTIAPFLGIGAVSFSFGNYWDNYYRGRPFYNERDRWEGYYRENYRLNWGPRPDHGNAPIVGLTVGSTRMRAGPDTDYPTIRTIRSGRQVTIYGCLSDWSWCDVSYGGDRGWVAGDRLATDYRGRRQTVVSAAPFLGLAVLSFSFGNYWDNYYRGRPFYRERSRWESHYYNNYRPSWGPRPDRRDNERARQQDQNRQRQIEQDRQQQQNRQQIEHNRQQDQNRQQQQQRQSEQERQQQNRQQMEQKQRQQQIDQSRQQEQNRQQQQQRQSEQERQQQQNRQQMEQKQRQQQIDQNRQQMEQNRQQQQQRQSEQERQQQQNRQQIEQNRQQQQQQQQQRQIEQGRQQQERQKQQQERQQQQNEQQQQRQMQQNQQQQERQQQQQQRQNEQQQKQQKKQQEQQDKSRPDDSPGQDR